MNHWLFYHDDDPAAGYFDYDHIVSVYEVLSDYDDEAFHEDDILVLSDHALYSSEKWITPLDRGHARYLYNCTFGDCAGNRTSANDPDGPMYTVPLIERHPYQNGAKGNYGIAHMGVLDEAPGGSGLARVVVETDLNYEDPEIAIK